MERIKVHFILAACWPGLYCQNLSTEAALTPSSSLMSVQGSLQNKLTATLGCAILSNSWGGFGYKAIAAVQAFPSSSQVWAYISLHVPLALTSSFSRCLFNLWASPGGFHRDNHSELCVNLWIFTSTCFCENATCMKAIWSLKNIEGKRPLATLTSF